MAYLLYVILMVYTDGNIKEAFFQYFFINSEATVLEFLGNLKELFANYW